MVDIWPDTDFPDTRKLTFVHSVHGVLLIIPRENGMVRLYIQQPSNAFINPNTGRVDKDRTSPQEILKQGQRILQPFRMEAIDDKFAWWTVYVGKCNLWLSMAPTMTDLSQLDRESRRATPSTRGCSSLAMRATRTLLKPVRSLRPLWDICMLTFDTHVLHAQVRV